MVTLDDLVEAQKAAINCCNACAMLHQMAWPKPLPARTRAQLITACESISGRPVAIGAFSANSLRLDCVPVAVASLCEAISSGRGHIRKVQDHLRRHAISPVSEGGLTSATAHELAFEYGHRLWLRIKCLDIRFFMKDQPPDCSLEEHVVREIVNDIADTLNAGQFFDSGRLRALIDIEHARSIASLQGTETKPTILRQLQANGEASGDPAGAANPTAARNAFMYEETMKGVPYGQIRTTANIRFPKADALTSNEGVRQGVRAHVRDHPGTQEPPQRTPGRPRKNTN